MAPSLVSSVISPILLLAGTLLFGILPIAVRRTLLNCGCDSDVCKPKCRARKGKIATSFLIYLGGGVLLATCLIHLLPEAREGFESHDHEEKGDATTGIESTTTPGSDISQFASPSNATEGGHSHEEFPMPEFVACCGFFAVYLVEEIIHYFLGGHSHVPTETRAIRSLSRNNSCRSSSYPGYHESVMGDVRQGKEEPRTLSLSLTVDQVCKESKLKDSVCAGFSVSSLLTVAALSFHSLFEGFAIGLQNTDSRLWILFAAVSVHKFVIAFVVGLEVLAAGGRDLLVVIYMIVFSSMSPIGMVIAMITQKEVEDSAPLLVGVLNAIATGTLLYVTFCEILQREQEHNSLKGWQQFIATFLGFGIMCIVQYASTLP